MTSLSTVDPNLESIPKKLIRFIDEKFFQDPTIQKLYHPKFKAERFFWRIRDQKLARERANDIRRKYQGNFTTYDILNENKLRLLCLNLGEMILLRNFDVLKQLKVSSLNLTKGFLQGYTMNLGLYLGLHGLSSRNLQNSEYPLLSYFTKFVGLSVLAYPLQYLAYQQFYFQDRARPLYSSIPEKVGFLVKGKETIFEKTGKQINILKMKRCFTPFAIFSLTYGASITAYNTPNEYVKFMYYPGILLSTFTLGAASHFFRTIQGVNTFKKTVELPFTAGFKAPLNFGSHMFFVLLNFCFPLVIPQLRSKAEYKHEYFDYLKENSVYLVGQESAFQ